jgi:hypothetical protein
MSADQYSLASLRYDLSKLRAKALVEKLPKSRRYRLCPQGYCICLVSSTAPNIEPILPSMSVGGEKAWSDPKLFGLDR